jgi:hypothetical protein
MRITLFDWTSGGHHPIYARRLIEAFRPRMDVVGAFPDDVLAQLDDLDFEPFSLGVARPPVSSSRPLRVQHRELAERELDLFVEVATRSRPDHLMHLYADPVIRRLVRRPVQPVATTVCVFFPRAHYPRSYGSSLAPREFARAWFLEYLVARWRRRRDAFALFALDEEAVRRWSRSAGARPYWLPEPPILTVHGEEGTRFGCVLYGWLAPRKGIDLILHALELAPAPIEVVLAGEVEPGFAQRLDEYADALRRTGAIVDLRPFRHDERQALKLLSSGRCVLLPYVDHYGASRVLVEAAAAGTPAIAHRDGLVGHLVRRHRLGLAVDCTDPHALRAALLELTGEDRTDEYGEALRRFASRYSATSFQDVVCRPFTRATPRLLDGDELLGSSAPVLGTTARR